MLAKSFFLKELPYFAIGAKGRGLPHRVVVNEC